jgi:hypothetical protein
MLDGMCAVGRPDPPDGISATAEEPCLYTTAEALADRFDQPRLDRIVLTLTWSVHTVRLPREAGPSAGELVLFTGLPCLGVLWWHELLALMGAAVGNPPGSELKHEHFQRAAQAGGSAAARSAYEKMHVFDEYWKQFVEQFVEPLVRRGLRPPMLHGFRAALEGAPVAELIRQLRPVTWPEAVRLTR